jgi:hypothetical protein
MPNSGTVGGSAAPLGSTNSNEGTVSVTGGTP